MEELTYEWPPHIGHYETRIFARLTLLEAIVGAMAGMIAMATFGGGAGLVAGGISAGLAILCVKKYERLGNLPLPLYLVVRLLARTRADQMELPLITAQEHAGIVEIEDWSGETIAVIE